MNDKQKQETVEMLGIRQGWPVTNQNFRPLCYGSEYYGHLGRKNGSSVATEIRNVHLVTKSWAF